MDRVRPAFARAYSTLTELSPQVWGVLKNLLYVRALFTVLIVGWALYISVQYNRTRDPIRQEQIKYTNYVWAGAGKAGVFMTLFWIWIVTILAVSAYPLVARLVPSLALFKR